ncbi:hypothetical protein [Streptomyces sp. NPDC054865]
MSGRQMTLRSLHDVGLAAWFGGTLMGAVGLNGAAHDEGGTWATTTKIASTGWARWTPVQAAAIAAHLVGSGGLLVVNAQRVAVQRGVAASTLAKTVLTGAALAATAYSQMLGKKIEHAAASDAVDTEAAAKHPIDTDKAQRHLACLSLAIPALTGVLVILNALHGEQQRPAEQARGMWQRARSLAPAGPPTLHRHFTH